MQVASYWSEVSEPGAGDWCYLQLRKQLCGISIAAGDISLPLIVRRDLQQLQLNILQGNIVMVARQGQQVRKVCKAK